MIEDALLEAEDKMDKAVEVAKDNFAGIRTGRVNPGLFSGVMVDYYGSPTPLQQLASFQTPEARTLLITPYDSIANVAAGRLPMFPVHWLLLDKYESWRYAPQITAPTRILAAEHDDVIPRLHTDALLRHFSPGIATLHVIPGTRHNTISADPGYLALLRAG